LHQSMNQLLQHHRNQLSSQLRTLAAVSPLNTLERGYSITQDAKTGEVISNAADVMQGQEIKIRVHRGEIECQVTGRQYE